MLRQRAAPLLYWALMRRPPRPHGEPVEPRGRASGGAAATTSRFDELTARSTGLMDANNHSVDATTTTSFPRKREPLFPSQPSPTEVPAFAGMTRWESTQSKHYRWPRSSEWRLECHDLTVRRTHREVYWVDGRKQPMWMQYHRVIPAKAGTPVFLATISNEGSRFRGNDPVEKHIKQTLPPGLGRASGGSVPRPRGSTGSP